MNGVQIIFYLSNNIQEGLGIFTFVSFVISQDLQVLLQHGFDDIKDPDGSNKNNSFFLRRDKDETIINKNILNIKNKIFEFIASLSQTDKQ